MYFKRPEVLYTPTAYLGTYFNPRRAYLTFFGNELKHNLLAET